METIEKVVYINLAYRTDRKAQIEKELSIFPSEKVLRFDAIKHTRGCVGCSLSHIAVLEMAIENNWKNILILEDDAIWDCRGRNIDSTIKSFFEKEFDVFLLGATFVKHNEDKKLISAQAATAYLVKQHYFKTLLSNFKEGVEVLKSGKFTENTFALDQYWKSLIKADNWNCCIPSIMIQSVGYSDILHKRADYTKYFI